MSIYGNNIFSLNENVKSKYKIKGVEVDLSDNKDQELLDKYVDKDIKTINKNWDNFLDQVADKFYEYILDCRENSSESFGSRFKSVKDVKSNIVFKSASYTVSKVSSGKIIRFFNPFIDFKNPPDEHVPTIEASVNDTGVKLDRIYFDG